MAHTPRSTGREAGTPAAWVYAAWPCFQFVSSTLQAQHAFACALRLAYGCCCRLRLPPPPPQHACTPQALLAHVVAARPPVPAGSQASPIEGAFCRSPLGLTWCSRWPAACTATSCQRSTPHRSRGRPPGGAGPGRRQKCTFCSRKEQRMAGVSWVVTSGAAGRVVGATRHGRRRSSIVAGWC